MPNLVLIGLWETAGTRTRGEKILLHCQKAGGLLGQLLRTTISTGGSSVPDIQRHLSEDIGTLVVKAGLIFH